VGLEWLRIPGGGGHDRPHGLRAAVPCLGLALASSPMAPKQKPLAWWLGVFALGGGGGHGLGSSFSMAS
jgi:hypothetical protein